MAEDGPMTLTAIELTAKQRAILREMVRRRGSRNLTDYYGMRAAGVIREALAEKAERMGIEIPWPPSYPERRREKAS